ncbi:peptide chain release factor 3 [Alkalispirochaeta sphaeroplastigenens]|uniref:Peptide chain release factor 3 n=1 Tax=Alkalispirochaeta sphaeroplastigenens TaxID=1187066 RepID=A0A2S4JX78_9SPIO|nr:peptide chain release factor 3 [Alkalispirochaeta sphaeroplastigenens]POR04114.1 peptide chain release factor 3 [Alkalispirochaeta sphaeroplastigenens]
MEQTEEIQRRRTFAIISHPDAGKTTLTEKLLLFGGGIRTAGAVKSNKITQTAASDFMEIEKQRGISVATAVMSFPYKGKLINILDTPGHKDFSEDTYRTLTAVDSVILVVDSVKGVEEQTERLMQVCRMRDTPVMIFINKMDREGRPPFELLDELEEKLRIGLRPLSWPISSGQDFRGVYNLHEKNLHLFRPGKTVVEEERLLVEDLDDPVLDQQTGSNAQRLRDDVALIEGVYDPFSREEYLAGRLAPVFFGSALNNFGVRELLETFVEIAPPPLHREAHVRTVDPRESAFTGFVFKIHANLDPRHRDRIAFLRICSGTFERSKSFLHVRQGKQVRFTSPYSFMAEKKQVIDQAFPGDVVGLYDRGDLKIGDTLTEGEILEFQGIPSFSPAIFKEVINADPMRSKQFHKGISQLTEEGVAQMFTQGKNKLIVGTVGELQYEVISYRLEHEYGAACRFEPLPYSRARWVTSPDARALEEFLRFRDRNIVHDKDDKPVYLAESEWILNSNIEKYPKVVFHTNSDFKLAQ